MGIEWDLMWDLSRLRKELGDGTRILNSISTPISSISTRHSILHIGVDRMVCFQRSLLLGHFKIRLTVSSARGSRPPITYESPLPFQSGRVLVNEGLFRVPIIVYVNRGDKQLSDWRFEFEILHKFPSSPIYSVVARSWVSADVLVSARAIDLFPSPGEQASVRLEFRHIHVSAVAVNLFKVAAQSVLFACKLLRGLNASKKTEAERLEKQIKYISERNASEKQAAQHALLMRSLEIMNKYLDTGSRPDDWVKSLIGAGLIPINNEASIKRIETQINDLTKQVVGLQTDLTKALNDNKSDPARIQYIQSVAPSFSPTAPSGPSIMDSIASALSGIKTSSNEPPIVTPSKAEDSMKFPAPSKETVPVVVAKVEEPEPEPIVVAAAAVEEELVPTSAEPLQILEEQSKEDNLVEDYTSTINNAVNNLWGAFNSAVGIASASGSSTPKVNQSSEKRKSIDTSPLISAVSGRSTPRKPPKESGSSGLLSKPSNAPALQEKSQVNSSPKKVSGPIVKKSAVVSPPRKPLDPKSALDAKKAAMKAKVATYLKVKALETKRKAEIEKREIEIKNLSSKLPPLDRNKFIGLPGPPPFKPKAKAVSDATLPSVMNQGETVDVPEDPDDNHE